MIFNISTLGAIKDRCIDKHETIHDTYTDTLIQIIILEIECNYMCRCYTSVGQRVGHRIHIQTEV